MSKILCIIDGMTDPDFAAGEYPNLAAMRLLRYVDTAAGSAPESLGCILRLLGVKRIPAYLRGYAEALGNNIPVGANDLVLRGSWFALDEERRCTFPVPAPQTVPQIDTCRYHCLGQHKSLLVFPGMAAFVSDIVTYPPYAWGGQSAEQLCPQGCREVRQVFQFLLSADRCLIPWGQSVSLKMVPFPQKAAVVCGTPIVKGIARLLDMTLIPVPGATGDVDTDLIEKGKAALFAAKNYPFVLLHINGADEAAHRRSPDEKRKFLQKVDNTVLSILLRSGHNIYVAVDHGTDPATGQHLGGVQPLFTSMPTKHARNKTDMTEKVLKSTYITEEQRRIWAIELLQRRAKELGYLPRKEDFGENDRFQIKGALGPWPRALEAAGLKEPKPKRRR